MPGLAGRGCVPAVVGLTSVDEPAGAVYVESIVEVGGFIRRLIHGNEEYPIQSQASSCRNDQSEQHSGAVRLDPVNGSTTAWHGRDSRISWDELAISCPERFLSRPG